MQRQSILDLWNGAGQYGYHALICTQVLHNKRHNQLRDHIAKYAQALGHVTLLEQDCIVEIADTFPDTFDAAMPDPSASRKRPLR